MEGDDLVVVDVGRWPLSRRSRSAWCRTGPPVAFVLDLGEEGSALLTAAAGPETSALLDAARLASDGGGRRDGAADDDGRGRRAEPDRGDRERRRRPIRRTGRAPPTGVSARSSVGSSTVSRNIGGLRSRLAGRGEALRGRVVGVDVPPLGLHAVGRAVDST